VNDEKMMRRFFKDNRVYAMITDKPDLAVSLKKNTSATSSGNRSL
jgi:hypothetical protein